MVMVGAAVLAQSPGATMAADSLPKKSYTNKTMFRLPVRIDEPSRGSVQEIRLYVKRGTGEWACEQTAPPTQSFFAYHAPQDGEYWFTVVTVNKQGQANPADVTREPPSLVVVVDTQAPDVEVRPLPVASGEVFLQCEIRDTNPDMLSCKLEYRAADQSWRPLDQLGDTPGIFRVPDAEVLTGQLRATVCDLAKNTAIKQINMAAAAMTASSSVLAPPPPPPPLGAEKVIAEKAIEKPITELPASIRSSASPVPTPIVQCSAASPARKLVNSTHTTMEYQIDQAGPSGIGKVEVWMTKDQGQTWQYVGEDADRKSPVEFDLPGEGTYGISLSVANGSGFGGGPPAKGDAPDCWIEVDLSKPTAHLQGVQLAKEGGAMMISWTADDKNLGQEPIDLYYAARPAGPWQPIARGVANNGQYRWSVPRDVSGQFYVKMEVTDQAGNVCRCQSPEPIVYDVSRPKARVLGIAAGAARTTTPAGN